MALVLDGPPDVVERAPSRRRRWLGSTAVALVLGLVATWIVVGQQPQLAPGSWAGRLDARPLDDGITTTRYVLSVDRGEQVVLSSIRNSGPVSLTVLGVDDEQSVSWVRASFRGRGETPSAVGYPSTAAARAAVTASSVTLEPGATADVLLTFDPPADLVMADGGYSELAAVPLSVQYLGLTSTSFVPLLTAPLTVVGGEAYARLEREGRFSDQG